jgi:hypothetical protein
MALLQKEFGKALYRCRDDVERCFGWLTNHAGGLPPLPNWVRREHRIRCWVQAKLIIHATYVYLYHRVPCWLMHNVAEGEGTKTEQFQNTLQDTLFHLAYLVLFVCPSSFS